MFFEIWKNVKYVFSNSGHIPDQPEEGIDGRMWDLEGFKTRVENAMRHINNRFFSTPSVVISSTELWVL